LAIEIKSDAEIAIMREAGIILADILDLAMDAVRPGVRETEIDELVRDHFKRRDVVPTFLGYNGYPATVCISVNDKIVHGIPGRRPFKDGDVVSIDLGCTHRGFVADSARTMAVGQVSPEVHELIAATKQALDVGIDQLYPDNRLGDVGAAIQQVGEVRGYGVVREYVGHGVGRAMHEDPQIPNFGDPGTGPELEEGMVLAIEPMVNVGTHHVRMGSDNWAVYSEDGSLAAHFEHTVAITGDGPRILTPWHLSEAAEPLEAATLSGRR
jgi:methionyl aminopeptidase